MKKINKKPDFLDQKIWDISLAFGCTDYDRCIGRKPEGSCQDCLKNTERVVTELLNQGYIIKCQSKQ